MGMAERGRGISKGTTSNITPGITRGSILYSLAPARSLSCLQAKIERTGISLPIWSSLQLEITVGNAFGETWLFIENCRFNDKEITHDLVCVFTNGLGMMKWG